MTTAYGYLDTAGLAQDLAELGAGVRGALDEWSREMACQFGLWDEAPMAGRRVLVAVRMQDEGVRDASLAEEDFERDEDEWWEDDEQAARIREDVPCAQNGLGGRQRAASPVPDTGAAPTRVEADPVPNRQTEAVPAPRQPREAPASKPLPVVDAACRQPGGCSCACRVCTAPRICPAGCIARTACCQMGTERWARAACSHLGGWGPRRARGARRALWA